MNADTVPPTTPQIPAPAPVGGPQPVVPQPGATEPPHTHPHTKAEPNALLEGTKKLWENLKAGKVGNPRVIALVLAVIAIAVAWWFLASSSKRSDSLLWYTFDLAQQRGSEGLKQFNQEPSQSKSVAGKIATLNDLRLQMDVAMTRLTSQNLKGADRVKAADDLERLRNEVAELAPQFDKDKTMKATAYLAAADAEMALVGVPKKDVMVFLDVKGGSRGQLSKYAEYLKQAAEAAGPNSDAGKQLLANAEKYTAEPTASDLYRRYAAFHARFNDPDPLPFGTGSDPSSPRLPNAIPGLTPPKPDDKPSPDAPKPPEGNPFEKK